MRDYSDKIRCLNGTLPRSQVDPEILRYWINEGFGGGLPPESETSLSPDPVIDLGRTAAGLQASLYCDALDGRTEPSPMSKQYLQALGRLPTANGPDIPAPIVTE